MLKKTLVSIAVSVSVFLLSCSGDSSTSPKNVNNAEITQDLQKIANSVDNFAMFEKNDKTAQIELFKSKANFKDTFYTLKPGVDVFQYSDSDGQYIDTTYTYAMDGVTLISDYYSLVSYKQIFKTYSLSSRYKSYAVLNLVVKNTPSTSDTDDYNCEMIMDGTGYIDYLNDSLILSFSKISSKSDNKSCTYDYRFTILDGKYNVSLVGSVDYSVEETADTVAVATGSIKLVSTGENAGILQLLYSGDVRILDNSGAVVKRTD